MHDILLNCIDIIVNTYYTLLVSLFISPSNNENLRTKITSI